MIHAGQLTPKPRPPLFPSLAGDRLGWPSIDLGVDLAVAAPDAAGRAGLIAGIAADTAFDNLKQALRALAARREHDFA